MGLFGRKYDPQRDDPGYEDIKGKANLEKNDFLALVIAAFTVFMPVLLLFVGLLFLLLYVIF